MSSDTPLVVYAGRLEKEKGVQTLIDAVPGLRRLHPGVRSGHRGARHRERALRARARRRWSPGR